jgi:hypothetical protein
MKFILAPPPICKILIIDTVPAPISQYFNSRKKSFGILLIRFEEIYVKILFRSILSGLKNNRGLMFNYMITYIDAVKPDLIISNRDMDIRIYKLEAIFENRFKVLLIQHGYRQSTFPLDTFSELESKVSFLLTWSNHVIKVYKKNIEVDRIITTGSLLNNLIPVTKQKYKNRTIGYISAYDEGGLSLHMINSLRIVANWCFSQNIDLIILGRYNIRDKLSVKERDFYFDILNPILNEFSYIWRKSEKEIFSGVGRCKSYMKSKLDKNNLTIHIRNNESENFVLSDMCDMVVGPCSSILYEIISRKTTPIAVINSDYTRWGKDFKFGWPNYLSTEGKYWTHSVQSEDVYRVLENSMQDLNTDFLDYLGYVNFDPGNTILKKLLDEIVE